ncbi:MAG: DM13 domain-containing protein [Minwuiales bacterium]|nr:DM13 domain-containing protein [Minwuiales bacterium]
MKKLIAVAFVAGLVGFVAGNAFWYLASPLWIDNVVSESVTAADTAKVLATGTFSDADAVHRGKGTATVYEGTGGQRTLRFTDFEVTNGPDLEVWLVAADTVTSNADVTGSEWVALGQLKGNIGDQNYDIPADVDLSKYRSVVIWCEQFGVLFSPAALK